MDPGHGLLQKIKTVPNLINEDPSITTPQNTAYSDRPWSEAIKHVELKKVPAPVSEEQQKGQDESTGAGNWDSATGYQDTEHNK